MPHAALAPLTSERALAQARAAVELYSQSVFCLQPPGDTIVRQAISDAIAVGCIPVFFHSEQARGWY